MDSPMESAVIYFVRDAFGRLKAIAVDHGGQAFLKMANAGHGACVVDADDKDAPVGPGKVC